MQISIELKKRVVTAIGTLGMVFTFLEISSYLIFFHHLIVHDNSVMENILQTSVIKQRNRANAISMIGQLAAWMMEVWYAFLIGFLSTFFDVDTLREVASLLKNYEFVLIPMIEVYTSASIRNFQVKRKSK